MSRGDSSRGPDEADLPRSKDSNLLKGQRKVKFVAWIGGNTVVTGYQLGVFGSRILETQEECTKCLFLNTDFQESVLGLLGEY